MNYEHLVQVNDPLNPLMPALSHTQLWQGLVLRAEQPQHFVLGLEQCTILSRNGDVIERELVYGPMARVRDRVTLHPYDKIEFQTAATAEHVGGSLTITIEAPDEAQLFVRFSYNTSLSADDENEATRTSEFVKSAYRESDIDTIRKIRELAEAGVLDSQSGGSLH